MNRPFTLKRLSLVLIILSLFLIFTSCEPTTITITPSEKPPPQEQPEAQELEPTALPAPAPVIPGFVPAPASTISAPKLTSPSNGATGVDLDLTFRWAIKAGTSAGGFELIIARDNDALSNICRSVSTSPTEYRPRENLEPSTRYYWMVVAKLDPADVNSPIAFSEVWTFITTE